jgi:hemoglobin/transferrin/lactoferrin receptor protein
MDHIPPVFGKSSVSYTGSNMGFEFYVMYNGWKRISDYNPDGEDNAQYATPDGMPCWLTLNARAQYRFNKNIALQLGLENLLDRNYRYFASGFSAAGRNVVIALRSGF